LTDEYIAKRIKVVADLEKARDEYITLLGDECSEYASFMSARNPGWTSSRFVQGKAIREKIENLTKQAEALIKEDKDNGSKT
jgi:hypothetical protein